jgi:hypothetical protein
MRVFLSRMPYEVAAIALDQVNVFVDFVMRRRDLCRVEQEASSIVVWVMYEGSDAQCPAFQIHIERRLKLVKAVKTGDYDESYAQ